MSKANELAQMVWQARTLQDVERIKALATEVYGPLGWRPIGDRPNNHGTVRMGSDPGYTEAIGQDLGIVGTTSVPGIAHPVNQ